MNESLSLYLLEVLVAQVGLRLIFIMTKMSLGEKHCPCLDELFFIMKGQSYSKFTSSLQPYVVNEANSFVHQQTLRYASQVTPHYSSHNQYTFSHHDIIVPCCWSN